MSDKNSNICPVERAGSFDNIFRRWLQNPHKILRPYIKTGMTVLDVGCGPGFFSVAMAQMVGKSGLVVATDMQEGMLQKVRDNIQGTELGDRIHLHKCEANQIGVAVHVDFVLAFYMVHEVPNAKDFFIEIATILKPGGKVLMVEPPFHVSKSAFEKTIRIAEEIGFVDVERPRVFFSKAVLLGKTEN